MKKLTLIFGGIILLVSSLTAKAQTFSCTQLNQNNSWLTALNQAENWQAISEVFHQSQNEKFNEQISKLQQNSIFSNALSMGFTKAHTSDCSNSDFITESFGPQNDSFHKQILTETQLYTCALFAKLNSNDLQVSTPEFSQLNLFQQTKNTRQQLFTEIELTNKTTVTALEAVGKMQTAYVIHKELECTIKSLENLRDGLSDLVGQMIRIPSKYINCGFECR
jgi:hypothetical protein